MIELMMRRRVNAEKALPYDAEVEYLESTGTQYINTGIMPDNTYTFDCGVAVLDTGYVCTYWGCRTSGDSTSNNSQCYCNSNTESTTAMFRHVRLLSTSTESSNNWDSGVQPFVGVMQSYNNMTVVSTMNAMQYPITLFALNNIGNILTSVGKCRISHWRAYSNGVLVMNLKAVRVGNIGYMYDTVSGQLFGNDGSGDFVVGQDVNATKPYDAQVEWIKTDGSAYIDTGISGKCRFEIVGGITKAQANAVGFFGSRTTNLSNAFCIFWFGNQTSNANKVRWDMGTGNSTQVQKLTYSQIANDSKFSYNSSLFFAGTEYITPALNSQSPSSGNHYLMAINTDGSVSGLQNGTYIKNASIIGTDGTLLRVFIPVRKNEVGYLYDTVSGTLFGNANSTGAFTYGNDVTT